MPRSCIMEYVLPGFGPDVARNKILKFPELSYASPDDPWIKRWIIQTIEIMAGRNYFVPLYEAWRTESVGRSESEIGDILKLLNTSLSINSSHWPPVDLERHERLVMIANHPFGIGDGIAILSLAEQLGRPFKILINKDLLKVQEMLPYSLSVDFSESREALATNIATRNEALKLIGEGTTIIIFPSGGVATSPTLFGRAEELPWKNFVARLVQSSRASVLPIYFEGQNSRLFQIASRWSMTLRLSLLVAEFRRFAESQCKLHIGEIVSFQDLINKDDRNKLIRELYDYVHDLAPLET